MIRTRRRGRRNHPGNAGNAVAEPPPDAMVVDTLHSFCIGLRVSNNRRWPNIIVRIVGADAAVRLQFEPSAVRTMRDLFDAFVKSLEVRAIDGRPDSAT